MSELHSLSALRQAADYLRAEERHWWADTIMAAIETLTCDDSAAEAIERVRELHVPYYPLRGGHPYCAACEGDEFVHYPCPTIQALEGVMGDE